MGQALSQQVCCHGSFHSHGIQKWFIVYFMDNPNLKWMMTGFGLFHGQSQSKMDDDWVWSISWTIPI